VRLFTDDMRRVNVDVWHIAVYLIVLYMGGCSRSSEPPPVVPVPSASGQASSSRGLDSAVEEPSHPSDAGQPTADEIARAQTVSPCALANGDQRFNGLLVRVTGTFQDSVIGAPLLLVGGCERLLYLKFDNPRISRLTPDGNRQFDAAATKGGLVDVVLVGMAQTDDSSAGRYGELTVYAIESVARRR
jgi:hypothetical protein